MNITADQVFAAGDHMNDLPMLSRSFARWLAAPQNAVDPVKEKVLKQNGFVSQLPQGDGVAEALLAHLQSASA